MNDMNELDAFELFDMLDSFCAKFYDVACREVVDGLTNPRDLGLNGFSFELQPTTLSEMRDMVHDLINSYDHTNFECVHNDYEEITDTYIKTLIGAAIMQHCQRVEADETY